MNNQYFVILFSKYSNVCKKFMDDVKNANLNMNFNILCVDNKQIREKILNSSDFDINSLPCLLVLNDSQNTVDKYEGQDAFIWLKDIIHQKQQLLLQEQQQKQLILQQQLEEKMKSKKTTRPTPVVDNVEDNNEPILSSEHHTSIDDIDSDGEDLSLDNTYKNLAKISNNGSSGNDVGDKKRPEQLKRDNLMSAALQMQKSREVEDKSINKMNPNL